MPRPKRHTKKAPALNLTSLVDIMTLVVVYLIKQMDAEGGIVQGGDNMKLPMSVAQTTATELSVTVQVNDKRMLVDGKEVVLTDTIRGRVYNPQPNDPVWIPEMRKALVEKCKDQRALMAVVEKQGNASIVSAGGASTVQGRELQAQLDRKKAAMNKIMLQLDRNIDYGVLLKVMATTSSILEDTTTGPDGKLVKQEQENCFPTLSFVVETEAGG
jgi:biopolymer transport protein ExbD